MGAKWTFYDPVVGDTYTFNINPNSDEETWQKNLQFEAVVIPGSLPLLYEGQDTPAIVELSGTLLTQVQHQTMIELFNRRHQIQLTDDLGVVRWVYIYEYNPTRTPSATFPWKRTYDLYAYLISIEFPS